MIYSGAERLAEGVTAVSKNTAGFGGEKSNEHRGRGRGRNGGESENVIPRAPRANYVKI